MKITPLYRAQLHLRSLCDVTSKKAKNEKSLVELYGIAKFLSEESARISEMIRKDYNI